MIVDGPGPDGVGRALAFRVHGPAGSVVQVTEKLTERGSGYSTGPTSSVRASPAVESEPVTTTMPCSPADRRAASIASGRGSTTSILPGALRGASGDSKPRRAAISPQRCGAAGLRVELSGGGPPAGNRGGAAV